MMKSAVLKMPSKPLRRASTASSKSPTPPPKRRKEELDPFLTRTGGAYIPPARLRMMREGITDKSSVAYQRLTWEAMKKSINGLINKVNVSNIANIVCELFQENLIRGKGLVARSLIQAQGASPMFTHVYAALVAIINTKLPGVGELIIRRLIVRFRKSFRRNDKTVCIATVKFIAHLVNQHVLYELVALELLTLLLEEPTDDSVEVAVGFIKDCGAILKQVNGQALHAVFETFRSILHSGKLTSRVQYMIEVLFAIRKDNFKDHPSILKELDLVHEDDQNTHFLSLADEDFNTEDKLNVFQNDPDYLENEQAYETIRDEILGEGVMSGDSESEEEGSEESEEESDEDDKDKLEISDQTGTSELAIRRQIYLTIMSSLDFEECAHKLLKTLKEGHERETAFMLVECCSQERSFMKFYGALGQRLCLLNQAWVAVFNEAFQQQYSTVHRLETNKLRNVSKFFGHLFFVDALPWTSLECIHINEEDTNSSSRIFIKILFQQLAEFMGLPRLNDRLRDPMLAASFEGILPRDNPKNTRFAINFFTSIGLGGLTDDLREHLKNAQKLIMTQKRAVSSSDSSSDDSLDEDSSSSESESEESTISEEEERRRRQKRKHEERHSDKKLNIRSEKRRTNRKKDMDEEGKGRRKDRDEEGNGRRKDRDEEGKGRRKDRDEERKDRDEERKGGRKDRDEERKEGRKDRDEERKWGRKDRDEERKERDEERKDRDQERRGKHARRAEGRKTKGERMRERGEGQLETRHRRNGSRDVNESSEDSHGRRDRHREEEEGNHGERRRRDWDRS